MIKFWETKEYDRVAKRLNALEERLQGRYYSFEVGKNDKPN